MKIYVMYFMLRLSNMYSGNTGTSGTNLKLKPYLLIRFAVKQKKTFNIIVKYDTILENKDIITLTHE